jgi:hypothetical protein
MSSYREVTKDDVGKMVQFAVTDNSVWHPKPAILYAVFEKPTNFGSCYAVVDDMNNGHFAMRCRIRTSPLPDGWLPDDWRVLGDEEICKIGDCVVCKSSPEFPFNTDYLHIISGGYVAMRASDVVSGVKGNRCVIRPRWRPATKDDVNKFGIGKHDDTALIKAIVERDAHGYDAWCLHKERGWCVARLSEMKVENEGWHVTN